jgi:hypothetical protein
MTTAELRDLIAPLKFFWLDMFAGDEAVQKEVLTELGLDAAEVLWALRFGQVPRMAIGQRGVRVVTWLAEPAGTIIEVHLLCVRRCIVTVWKGEPATLDEARRHFVERAAELEKNHFNAAAIVLQLLLATVDQVITIFDTKLHAVREELHRAPHTSEVAALTGELQRQAFSALDTSRLAMRISSPSAVRFFASWAPLPPVTYARLSAAFGNSKGAFSV